MEIERAKWYISDFSILIPNSDFREAIDVLLNYIKKLEDENQQYKETKRA